MIALGEVWPDLARARHRCIGFPVATDVSFTDMLSFQSTVIPTDPGGEIRYDRLAAAARDHPTCLPSSSPPSAPP